MSLLLPFARARVSRAVLAKGAEAGVAAHFLPILTPAFRALPPQGLPDYWAFTSANGPAALAVQPWWGEAHLAAPAYCVGTKTASAARTLGFAVTATLPPPATSLLSHLPTANARGLWVRGAEVAWDLQDAAQAEISNTDKPDLRSLIGYDMTIDAALQNDMQQLLAKDQIRCIFVTSARFVRLLADLLVPKSDLSTDLSFVCLGPRLAELVQQTFGGGVQVKVVADLDTGVEALYLHAQSAKETNNG